MTSEYKEQKDVKQRGASDFRADYELTDNPYSANDVKYYLWKSGFLAAKEQSKQ